MVGAAQLVTVSFTISGNKPFGNATVACEGGCECDATKLLGRTRYPITVMAQRRVPLRGAGDGCTLLLKAEGGRMQVRGTRPGEALALFLSSVTCHVCPTCALCLGMVFRIAGRHGGRSATACDKADCRWHFSCPLLRRCWDL